LHERLRQELIRRVQRGTLSVSLLSRQTGMGQPHLSNFLRGKRQLSLAAMDRVFDAQRLAVADLLPAVVRGQKPEGMEQTGAVPVVSHAAAMLEPHIRPAASGAMVYPPSGFLESLRSRTSPSRRAWLRFVAVRAGADDALAMEPLLVPGSTAVLDRHYNSLTPYHPDRPNLYAIRNGGRLALRFADFLAERLVLRPLSNSAAVELLEIDPNETPNDLIAGRVALVLNES